MPDNELLHTRTTESKRQFLFATRYAKRFRKKGLDEVQQLLLEGITKAMYRDDEKTLEKSAMEIGCGVGGLLLTVLANGVQDAIGIDASNDETTQHSTPLTHLNEPLTQVNNSFTRVSRSSRHMSETLENAPELKIVPRVYGRVRKPCPTCREEVYADEIQYLCNINGTQDQGTIAQCWECHLKLINDHKKNHNIFKTVM